MPRGTCRSRAAPSAGCPHGATRKAGTVGQPVATAGWAFGPVSGAHFNPVAAADWLAGRRRRTGLTAAELGGTYIAAQIGGAIAANVMFDQKALQISTHHRVTSGHLFGEIVATAGLLMVILALARTGRAAWSATAVAARIGAATGSPPPPPSPTRGHDRADLLRHLRRDHALLHTRIHNRPNRRRPDRTRPDQRPLSRHRRHR
ncbi:aquaporin [Nocardia sp. NPDC052112]|uniref:aquaporin n=1 Tax=Nocardia sp. NPDC052112 TaxID=3155646 RepID=UPI00343FD5BD